MEPTTLLEFPEFPVGINGLDCHGETIIVSSSRGIYKFNWVNGKFIQISMKSSKVLNFFQVSPGKLLMHIDHSVNFWDSDSLRPLFIKSIRRVLMVERDIEVLDRFTTIDGNNCLVNWRLHDKNLIKESVF